VPALLSYLTADPPTIHLQPEAWRAAPRAERRVQIANELAADRLDIAYSYGGTIQARVVAEDAERHAAFHASRSLVTNLAVVSLLVDGEMSPAAAAARWGVPESWAIQRIGDFVKSHRAVWARFFGPGTALDKLRWLYGEYLPDSQWPRLHRQEFPECTWPHEELWLLCAVALLAGLRLAPGPLRSPAVLQWARVEVAAYARRNPQDWLRRTEPFLLDRLVGVSPATPLQRLCTRLLAGRVAVGSGVLASVDRPWEYADPWSVGNALTQATCRVLLRQYPHAHWVAPVDADQSETGGTPLVLRPFVGGDEHVQTRDVDAAVG
jgi:hypothetical protein